jgi:hypothetical protein
LREQPDARAVGMKNPVARNRARRGIWIAFALLAVLAAFMYVSIMIKVMRYGF